MTFEALGLEEKLLEAIGYMGFETATPVQEKAIPEILAGKDLMACAQTGTGKTAAFILPALNEISRKDEKGVQALVITPTRELALQIDQQIQGFSYFLGISSISIYGGGTGHDFTVQKDALKRGVEIIVATPGQLLSHINLGYVKLDQLKYLILDEADRMLDMGFNDDIMRIIGKTPTTRQTLLFSATMPPKIRKLGEQILKDPVSISLAISKPAEGLLQAAYVVYENQKPRIIRDLIEGKKSYSRIIIFTSTKKKVSEIVQALDRMGDEVLAVSSDLNQSERELALRKFRAKQVRILVATDVLSRGIDIKDINLVINYDVPNDAEDYVHRIGRTARAETTGVAITMITPEDAWKFKKIEELIEMQINKIPVAAVYGKAPVYEEITKKRSFQNKGPKKKFSPKKFRKTR